MSINFLTVASTLATLLPSISHLFNGAEATGTTDALTTKLLEIARKVAGTPDSAQAMGMLQKSPELLLEFQRTVLHIQHDLERAFLDDKRDARVRDVALMTAGRGNRRADIMVIAAAIGLTGCLVCLIVLQGKLPGEATGIISTIAGIFGACLKDAYGFEFGSSRGSQMKDMAALARLF